MGRCEAHPCAWRGQALPRVQVSCVIYQSMCLAALVVLLGRARRQGWVCIVTPSGYPRTLARTRHKHTVCAPPPSQRTPPATRSCTASITRAAPQNSSRDEHSALRTQSGWQDTIRCEFKITWWDRGFFALLFYLPLLTLSLVCRYGGLSTMIRSYVGQPCRWRGTTTRQTLSGE